MERPLKEIEVEAVENIREWQFGFDVAAYLETDLVARPEGEEEAEDSEDVGHWCAFFFARVSITAAISARPS